jgi:hypothetical protein
MGILISLTILLICGYIFYSVQPKRNKKITIDAYFNDEEDL